MIDANITRENQDAGYRVELQIHHGEISLTQVADADWERSIVPGLSSSGDMEATLPDLIDLLTRLVDASQFKRGDKVGWKGSIGPRCGTVHSTHHDGGWGSPTVTVRTDKGGYTKVAAVHLERI